MFEKKTMKKLLVLDDNLTICLMLKSWIVKKGYTAETATSVEEAKQMVKDTPFDLILSDIRMPDSDGFSFLSWVKKYDSDILVIMMTSFSDIETAVESMKSGAIDYISKPIDPDLLFKKIDDAFKKQSTQNENRESFNEFSKPPLKEYDDLIERIEKFAENNQHFLLLGDRGTGKASLVKFVYQRGFNNSQPLVVLDYEQEQNGNVNTQEPDKTSKLKKKIEAAKGGLLYIKRVQKLDTIAQDELLSLLTKQKKDENFVQVIVGSEKSVEKLKQSLLPKLYQLLEKEIIQLPSLKGKKEEILFYADHFLKFANAEFDKNINSIAPEVQKQFLDYSWPRNIQELKNLVIKAALLTDSSQIEPDVLPSLFENIQNGFATQQPETSIKGLRKENYEKEKIIKALELSKGNKTTAASILNIDRKTLYNKIKLYNIEFAN